MRGLASILVLLVLPLAGPAAGHAVPADFSIEPFDGPLLAEEARTSLLFDYRCGGMTTNATDPDMSLAFQILEAPSWAELRVEPASLALEPCVGTGRAEAALIARATPGTVAAPATATIAAAWTTAGIVLNEEASVRLELPWSSALRVEAPVNESVGKPQSVVVFPMTLHNEGNGLVKVGFELVSKSESLQVPLPNPVTLQGAEGQQRSAVVPITVQTPYRNGHVDDDGSLTLRIVPSDPTDPRQSGEPQEVTFRVRTEGFYVPAAPAIFLVLALGAAACFTRR